MTLWRWRNKLRREGRRRSATTVADRPQPDIPAWSLPAPKATFDWGGDQSTLIFDKHGDHLPT